MEFSVSVDLSGGQNPLLLYWQADHFIFIFTSYSLHYPWILFWVFRKRPIELFYLFILLGQKNRGWGQSQFSHFYNVGDCIWPLELSWEFLMRMHPDALAPGLTYSKRWLYKLLLLVNKIQSWFEQCLDAKRELMSFNT